MTVPISGKGDPDQSPRVVGRADACCNDVDLLRVHEELLNTKSSVLSARPLLSFRLVHDA